MEKLELLRQGKWLNGFDPEYTPLLEHCAGECHRLNMLPPSATAERKELLSRLLGRVGENVLIHSPFRCDFGFNIEIGDNFVGNFGLSILDEARVVIGDNVFIGPNTDIYTIIHALLPSQRNVGVMSARPVTIGDDVWIGGRVTILPGVTIGAGAVIGAGSVVTADIPPLTLAVGNPCRPMRPITDDDRVTIVEDEPK